MPSPKNVTIDDFNGFLASLVPNMTSAGQDTVRALYLDPASHESIWDRTTALISDILTTCHAQVVASSYAAHGDSVFRYIFAVPPAKHGDDLSYTFYSYGDNPADGLVANTSVASVLPRIITSLSISGIPEFAPSRPLEKYGTKQNVLVINKTAVHEHIGDPWKNARCEFWQKGDYFEA